MAKKRAAKKPGPKPNLLPDKIRMEMRFDPDIYEEVKAAAADAGISMNQLVQGMCRGCMRHLIQGEATRDRDGFVSVKRVRGVVSFGRPGSTWEQNQRHEFEEATGEDAGPYRDAGELFFTLDFTERVIVPDRE